MTQWPQCAERTERELLTTSLLAGLCGTLRDSSGPAPLCSELNSFCISLERICTHLFSETVSLLPHRSQLLQTACVAGDGWANLWIRFQLHFN